MEKISKSRRDRDLDQAMPNVELGRAIFIYYSMFKFQVDCTIIFWSYCVHRQQTDSKTDTQTASQTQTGISTL